MAEKEKRKEPAKKKSSFFWNFFVFIIISISIIEGYIIFKGKRFVDKHSDEESFVRFFGKEFRKDKEDTEQMFDDFFNADFFKQRKDPFKDMEEIRDSIAKKLKGDNQTTFKEKFNNWYDNKFSGSGITYKTQIGSDNVTVMVHIPGIEKEGIDVVVEDGLIKISGEQKQTTVKKDSTGRVIEKTEKMKSFYHTLSVPSEADPNKFEIDFVPGTDNVNIVFHAKLH